MGLFAHSESAVVRSVLPGLSSAHQKIVVTCTQTLALPSHFFEECGATAFSLYVHGRHGASKLSENEKRDILKGDPDKTVVENEKIKCKHCGEMVPLGVPSHVLHPWIHHKLICDETQ